MGLEVILIPKIVRKPVGLEPMIIEKEGSAR